MCIFCKIINNEIPSYKLYEDDQVIAFLDISQSNEGHTLVIPKKHIENIHEMDAQTAADLYSVVPKLATAIKSAVKADGINIINNNGSAAGQVVFHYHVHILPRFENDGIKLNYTDHTNKYNLDEIRLKIQKEM